MKMIFNKIIKKFKTMFIIFIFILIINCINVIGYDTFNLYDGNKIYYKFEESTTPLLDSNIFNRINASCVNCPLFQQSGKLNYSLLFDGTNDELLTDINSVMNSSNKSFTVNLWLKTSDINRDSNIYGIFQGSYGTFMQVIYTGSANNYIQYIIYTNSSNYLAVKSNDNVITDNTWNMLTVIRSSSSSGELYINGINETYSSILTGNVPIMDLNQYYIGSIGDNNSEWLGSIDEFSYYNYSLSQSDITYLYNFGNPDSSQQYPYDYQLPSLSLYHESPQNNSHINNDNILIKYNVSKKANCSLCIDNILNVTQYNILANITQTFNISLVIEKLYNYTINCSRSDGLKNSTSYYKFVYDTTEPIINLYNPLSDNNSIYDKNNTLFFIANYSTSDNSLYQFNYTLWRLDNSILYNDEQLNLIGSTNYNNTHNISIQYLNNGIYKGFVESSDSHTNKYLPVAKNVYQYPDSLLFEFHSKEINPSGSSHNKSCIIEITSNDKDNIISMNTEKLKDRYTFITQYNKNMNQATFNLKSNNPIIYLSDSDYKGHFITNNYWIDFEDNYFSTVNTIKITDYHYSVIINYQESLPAFTENKFHSIGGLNINKIYFEFEIINSTYTPPPQNETEEPDIIQTPLTNVLLGYVLLFIYIILLMITVILKDGVSMIFTILMAIAISIFFASIELSNFIIIIFIGFNIYLAFRNYD